MDTVREGIELKEEGAEDGGGEDESEITGMEEDDLTQEGENNTTDQQPEEDKKDWKENFKRDILFDFFKVINFFKLGMGNSSM